MPMEDPSRSMVGFSFAQYTHAFCNFTVKSHKPDNYMQNLIIAKFYGVKIFVIQILDIATKILKLVAKFWLEFF